MSTSTPDGYRRQSDGKTPVGRQSVANKKIMADKRIADDKFMAAAIGDVEWLKQSLKGNKNTSDFDKNGLSPIHLAAIHGRLECLKYLVEKQKVDVNLPSSTGWRPVHLCISNQTGKRAFQSLLYLLEKGADPSALNDDKISPAHQAASEGHVQCLKALIEVGGVIDSKDIRGHLPIDLAKLWGHRKCARILAAETWHQSKDFLAKEMKQLQKLQMQQAVVEIAMDESEKAEKQLYGEQAFNQWLESRGLTKSPNPPKESKGKGKSGAKQKVTDNETNAKLRPVPKRNVISKPNSMPPPKAPSPIQEETHAPVNQQKRVQLATKQNVRERRDSYESRGYSDSDSEDGLYEKKAKTPPPPEDDKANEMEENAGYYQTVMWNKSTKIPGKDYVKNLEDHYPRDEFTMLPKHPPKRYNRSPTLLAEITSKETSANSSKRMPKLPVEVIKKKLEPMKYERPVVYKCKHIEDVHKRHHPEFEDLPRQEAAIHLCSDTSATLFRNALTIDLSPGTPSTAISGVSSASQGTGDGVNISPGVVNLMKQMSKKDYYPDIKGKQYDINFGQVAAI